MNFLPILEKFCLYSGILISLLYAYQVLYLFVPRFLRDRRSAPAKPNRYAILIAARNEEAVLPYLLESIRAQDYPAARIDTYVIADNCNDETARVAAEGGATVYLRFNRREVGKGYALQYLIEQLRMAGKLDQYDAFLIFDADNLLESDYITKINSLPSRGYQAFCGYRNSKNFGSTWVSMGSALWYLHQSAFLNQSRYLLGSSASVSGTGFGFTRALLEKMGGWNFLTLTEDIEFSTWCAAAGVKIGYCNDAVLYDEQPLTFRQSWVQRTRWAKGGIQVSVRYLGAMLRGLFRFGWVGWACLELLTLSLWGFGFTGVFSVAVWALSFLMGKGLPLLPRAFLVAYGSLVFVGAWTTAREWRRIRAGTAKKIQAIFAFPIYVMTFAPITLWALVAKKQWQPIRHTVAISAKDLAQDNDPFLKAG